MTNEENRLGVKKFLKNQVLILNNHNNNNDDNNNKGITTKINNDNVEISDDTHQLLV